MPKLPEASDRKKWRRMRKEKGASQQKGGSSWPFQQWPAKWRHLNLRAASGSKHGLSKAPRCANLSLVAGVSVSSIPKYCCIATHNCTYTYTWEHNQLIMTTSITNEYTSLYKYISITLYFRKGDVCCVWKMSGDKGRLLSWPQILLSTMAALLSHLGLGLLNRGSLRAQSPLSGAGSHFGILSPTNSNRLGTWLHYCLTFICFCCSSAYLHRCISWLTARSSVNI